jgi:wobble nucleotide-excising tRNase
MIRKILTLKNIGLLHDATDTGAVELGQVTAVYADNGRGKSTVATILRACQLGDHGRLNARKTIDAISDPEIRFLLNTGAQVEFKANAWSTKLQDIVVFDSEFVEQNVYSGYEVRAEQRQSLLEFALGDQTVQLKLKIDQLTQDIEVQTRKRTQAEKTLTGFAVPYTVTNFVALQPVPNVQNQIDDLGKRIEAAKNAQALNARKEPTEISAVQIDLGKILTVLSTQINDVQESAENIVKAHLAKHEFENFEDWVSRGQTFLVDDSCSFCGQRVDGLELIAAYRSYFNTVYAELKTQVAELEKVIQKDLGDLRFQSAFSAAASNTARVEAWKDQLTLDSPALDEKILNDACHQVRDRLLSLVSAKQSTPLDLVGSRNDLDFLENGIDLINQKLDAYNAEIRSIVATILDFKKKLGQVDSTKLTSDLRKLEAAQKRELPTVTATVAEYQDAGAERSRLDTEKTNARQQLDLLMLSTLQQYQTSINGLLTVFGAEFSIEQLKPNYAGGEPRTEYGLSIRNKPVKLGSRADITAEHSFATALSEADKRTLAFAFFVARLNADPNLGSKLVVLDDPVSSLDRNRRHQTVRQIVDLASRCKQLIVLSHDPFFLRDLGERLANLRVAPITPKFLAIERVQNGYSAFGKCDIDDLCASDYYRHHRMVADYVDGKSTANKRDVAKAIRPLLEGYYHRRFPGSIPQSLMFGQVIALAVDPVTIGPLTNLRPLAKELGEVNDYAGQFHHDTNQLNADTTPVVDTELLHFARRALNLIYTNG